MRQLRVFPVLVGVAILVPLAAAQSNVAGSQESPLVKRTTREVIVDVVVTGAKNAPVDGLKQQDFTLLEDGKPQNVDFFEDHSARPAANVSLPQMPPGVYSNAPSVEQGQAVTVLLLDSLNTQQADQANANRQIADFVGKLQPGTPVAVYSLNSGLRLLQGFTADGALLKTAINNRAFPQKNFVTRSHDDNVGDADAVASTGDMYQAQGESRTLSEFAHMQQGNETSMTLTALQQLGRSLAAVPGRKNLVWFASTFPVGLFADTGSGGVTESANGRNLPEELRKTVNLLSQARIAVYPVTAQGLLLASHANDASTPNTDSLTEFAQGNFNRISHQDAQGLNAVRAAMIQLATDTGGEAIYATNDTGAALSHDIQDAEHYYTLAYTPANEEMTGKFRHIEVKVNAGKYNLAYRRGYYAGNDASLELQPADPLAPLLADGAPDATQIVYRIRVNAEGQPAKGAPRAGGNGKLSGRLERYKVEFLLPAQDLNFSAAQDGERQATVKVGMVVYGHDGKPANWSEGAMTLRLNELSYQKAVRTGIAAPMEIDVPEGKVTLATGIWDTNTRRAGTLQVALGPGAAVSAH